MLGFDIPDGFLGTRADMLFDIIVVAQIAVTGALVYAIRQAKMKRYLRHRAVMLATLLVLALILVVFEVHLRASGGARGIFEQSRFADTTALTAAIYIHILFAVSTVVAWTTLAILSLVKYRRSLPGDFSRIHRIGGWIVL